MAELSNTVFDIPVGVWVDVLEFDTRDIRSCKLFIQGSSGNEHQTSEVFLIHDNSLVYLREVFQAYTRDPYLEFTASLTGNTVYLKANTSLVNTDIIVLGTGIPSAERASSNSDISQDSIISAAAAMKGLYPDDTTDYVALQAGSLFRENLVAELDREIADAVAVMNSPEFDALDDVNKAARMTQLTNGINERRAALQASIDADLSAVANVSSQVEMGAAVAGIAMSYSDPNAKALLDLTLNSATKAALVQ
jgi:hypothetical protein